MASLRDRTLTELADFARLVVRSGYLPPERVRQEVALFVRAEIDDEQQSAELAEQLTTRAEEELAAERADWPERTDNDALAAALAALRERGWLTLEYCEDHFDARRLLQAHPQAPGIVFFTDTDVWHAITDRMLELKVWHADTSNMVAADPELAMVIELLAAHGLTAVFDEGRVEVTFGWRRR
ncbi:MAG: DUF6891 domain-containing protein [Propionibacteriaceae bacterium]